MEKNSKYSSNVTFGIFGSLMFMYFGYVMTAAYVKGAGIEGYMNNFFLIVSNPLKLYYNDLVPIGVVSGALVFQGYFLWHLMTQKNYMRGKEYGVAHWENPENVNNALADMENKIESCLTLYESRIIGKPREIKVNTKNMRISENIYMTLDTRYTDLNNNIFIIGGSGAGKTFRWVLPNLMQMFGSFICTDPKGEILKKSAGFLKRMGYEIKVLNLLNEKGMKKSSRYNPFRYLESDADVLKLVTNFMTNTKKKDAGADGQFWDDMAGELLTSLIHYVWKEGVMINGKMDHSFKGVVYLFRKAEFVENPLTGGKEDSELDIIMNELEMKEQMLRDEDPERPEHQALIFYNKSMRGAADTVRSIIQSLNARFASLENETVLDLLSDDEIDIPSIGEKRTAVFCVIPDNDKTFNWAIGMLYSQAFQVMYHQADFIYDGELPVHVTFMLDEFANVALPDDFLSLLATMRSRNISSVIIVQALAQVKKLFKDGEWENITANCDTTIYLGSNEQSAHKFVSELLGKMTIDKFSTSKSYGKNGSSSKSDDSMGRELMFENEVRQLSKKECIIFIRGFFPIKDYKIQTNHLPMWKYFNKYSKNYRFDGRIERVLRLKERGIGQGQEEYLERVFNPDELLVMAKKDQYRAEEYEEELHVARETGMDEPDKPVQQIINLSLEELFSLEEAIENDSDEFEVDEEVIIKNQLRLIEEIKRKSSVLSMDDLIVTGETEEAKQETRTRKKPQKVETREHIFIGLCEHGYSVEQIQAIMEIMDYTEGITETLIYRLFSLEMPPNKISNYIQAFYG